MEEKTEGILLQSIAYLGEQRILKVFTPQGGLLSLIAKKRGLTSLTIPFCLAEWVFRKGKEEIHLLQDGTVLDDFYELKREYAVLNAAGQMARDLLQTQLPGKRGSELYALFHSYLKRLPEFGNPAVLNMSFRLKLLLHEGLLSLDLQCAQCTAAALNLSGGESTCSLHTTHPNISFSREEWESLHLLGLGRKFSLMRETRETGRLREKINALFEERLRS